MCVCVCSVAQLCLTLCNPQTTDPQTVVHQGPLSMEFSRQEYWSGLSFPSPGNLPNPGIEPRSPALQAETLPSEPPGKSYQRALIISLIYVILRKLLIHHIRLESELLL